jgi:peptide/nickel transport system permease protein
LVLIVTVWADYLPLLRYDAMDWKNLASPPGTQTETLTSDNAVGEPLSKVYLLGTDTMGRDILARLIFGARVSLYVGLTAPLIGLFIGGMLGMLAGFYRGRLESIVMAVMDAILAFPAMLLLLTITFYMGPTVNHIILALGFLTIPSFARIARANTLRYSQRDFVQASHMIGQRDIAILISEILPNILVPLMVYALLMVSYMIIAEGALSFLGLGVPSPTPSWGGMIAEGKEVLEEAGHVSLIPALIMFLTILAFNLMGDALRGVIDARDGGL